MIRPLKVGQGYRDTSRTAENLGRVVFVVALDDDYAYVRAEKPSHRRSRIERRRLESSAYSFVGEFGKDPSIWPEWFREGVEGS